MSRLVNFNNNEYFERSCLEQFETSTLVSILKIQDFMSIYMCYMYIYVYVKYVSSTKSQNLSSKVCYIQNYRAKH